jgi:hydrogenase-4 component D
MIGAALYFLGIVPTVFKSKFSFIAVSFSLITLLISLFIVYFSIDAEPQSFTWGRMQWIEGTINLFGALIDHLSIMMLFIVSVIGFMVVVFSTKYMTKENKEHPGEKRKVAYYAWLLLFIGSMIGIAISPNLLQFLIFWELTTICSAALIAFYETEKGFKAGFKALLMTHAPGLFFFVAVALVFINTKSFSFESISTLDPTLKTVVILFLLFSAWAKSAQVPFYTWLPDAMEAPTPISGYLHAAAMVKAGVFLIARVAVSVYQIPPFVGLIVGIMALITMYIGLIFYFRQDDLKRLLAFSTITHLGYIFVGLGLGMMGSDIALKGGLLHLICHAFSKIILFLCVGVISYLTGVRLISKLSGLSKKMPVVTFAFIVGVLSVTGIPPFPCFWSKFFILAGAISLKNYIGVIFVVLILLESIGSFYWFLRIMQKVFFGKSEDTEKIVIPGTFKWTLIILVILSLLVPFLGMILLKGVGLKV